MEEDSLEIPDIETAGGAAVQEQLQDHRTKSSRKCAIATGLVALSALVVVGAVIGTRQPDEGVSDGVQALSQHLHQGSPNLGTATVSVVTAVEECAIGGKCSEEGAECAIGTETCCGETFNSIECECSGEEWMCYYTEACMKPDCGDLNTTAPSAALPSFRSFAVKLHRSKTKVPPLALVRPAKDSHCFRPISS